MERSRNPVRLALAALVAVSPAPLVGQGAPPRVPPTPVFTEGLATGPFSVMEVLYERTVFKVDIFTLRVAVGASTAEGFRRVVAGSSVAATPLDDLATIALASEDLLVQTLFHRSLGTETFLDGLRANVENAERTGHLTPEDAVRVLEGAAYQYAPLRDRGFRAGDTAWYRIEGDSLHFALLDGAGSVMAESHVSGSWHRKSLLASYFAPGSEFREPLLRQLLAPGDRDVPQADSPSRRP